MMLELEGYKEKLSKLRIDIEEMGVSL